MSAKLTAPERADHHGDMTGGNPLAASKKAIDTDDVLGMGSWYGNVQGENIFKDLLDPGKELDVNMLRSVIRDEKQLNNMVRAITRYETFGQSKHLKMLRLKVIGLAGISGYARTQAIMAYANVIAPDVILSLLGKSIPKEQRARLARDMRDQEKANRDVQNGG